MSRAVNIDIDTEIKAIENGECGMCRVGATHKDKIECNATHQKRFDMKYCSKCEHMWCKNFFSECPICKANKHNKTEIEKLGVFNMSVKKNIFEGD